MVINLTDSQQQVPLQIQGMQPKQADVWRFDATHNAVDLGQQAMPADGRLVLPAQSITFVCAGEITGYFKVEVLDIFLPACNNVTGYCNRFIFQGKEFEYP